MFDYRRGWVHGRSVALQAERHGWDAQQTRERADTVTGGRDARWVDGFRQGFTSFDPARSYRTIKARALQPASPQDTAAVRAARSSNAWQRARIRLNNKLIAVFVGVVSVGVVVATLVARWHWVYLAMWAVCAAWSLLGCRYLPARAVRAELAEQRSWADPDLAGLRRNALRGEAWSLLVGANAVAGIVVLLVLLRFTA